MGSSPDADFSPSDGSGLDNPNQVAAALGGNTFNRADVGISDAHDPYTGGTYGDQTTEYVNGVPGSPRGAMGDKSGGQAKSLMEGFQQALQQAFGGDKKGSGKSGGSQFANNEEDPLASKRRPEAGTPAPQAQQQTSAPTADTTDYKPLPPVGNTQPTPFKAGPPSKASDYLPNNRLEALKQSPLASTYAGDPLKDQDGVTAELIRPSVPKQGSQVEVPPQPPVQAVALPPQPEEALAQQEQGPPIVPMPPPAPIPQEAPPATAPTPQLPAPQAQQPQSDFDFG
jgi:hypothetical protein